MSQIIFKGKTEDDYARPMYVFEAEKVPGFECSLVIFGLRPDGTVAMGSKYFHNLPKQLRSEIIEKAKEYLPKV